MAEFSTLLHWWSASSGRTVEIKTFGASADPSVFKMYGFRDIPPKRRPMMRELGLSGRYALPIPPRRGEVSGRYDRNGRSIARPKREFGDLTPGTSTNVRNGSTAAAAPWAAHVRFGVSRARKLPFGSRPGSVGSGMPGILLGGWRPDRGETTYSTAAIARPGAPLTSGPCVTSPPSHPRDGRAPRSWRRPDHSSSPRRGVR